MKTSASILAPVALFAATASAAVRPEFSLGRSGAGFAGRTRSVTARGGCNRRFERVYGALARAAGVEGA